MGGGMDGGGTMDLLPLPVEPLPKAVIFDCDGTLVDSMPVHYEGWSQAFAAVGAEGILPRDEYLSLGGMPGRAVVELVNAKHGLDLDVQVVLDVKRAAVRGRVGDFRALAPGACWAAWCHEQGLPMAVASGGTRVIVLESLRVTGMDAWFSEDRVFTADDVPRGKPHPDLFLAAAAHLGHTPEDTLVVEDGPPGFQAAEAAGMRWVSVG